MKAPTMHVTIKPTVQRTIYLARPRDPDESKRGPGERTLESYRKSGPWVVDCYNAQGKWIYAYYGPRNMSRATSIRKAAQCQRIQDDFDAKVATKHRVKRLLVMPDGKVACLRRPGEEPCAP
jgi:hypothetical protein